MAAGDLIFAHSFEEGDITKAGLTAQTVTGGTMSFSSTQKHGLNGALRIQRTAALPLSYRLRTSDTLPPFPTGKTQISGSCFFYIATMPTVNTQLANFLSNSGGGVGDCQLFVNNGALTGQLFGLTAQSLGTVTTGVWYQIEWQWDVSGTTWTGAMRLNGGTPITFSKASQVADTCIGIYELGWSASTSANCDYYLDDLILVEGISWLGGVDIVCLHPDETPAELDSNYTITGTGVTKRADAIDDVRDGVTVDDVTTYLQSATSSQIQRVELTSYTLKPGESVIGAYISFRGGSTATTTPNTVLVNLQNSAGTDGTNSSMNVAVNGWQNQSAMRVDSAPPGGGSWTQAVLDGLRMKFTKAANTNTARITSAFVYLALKSPTIESWNAVPA